jgi:hypothetical protein
LVLVLDFTRMQTLAQLADFKKSMETWALLRLAFGCARVALGRSGQVQIAARSFSGATDKATGD